MKVLNGWKIPLPAFMKLNADHIRDRFCVAGLNYRKADTGLRGLYAVDEDVHARILDAAREMQIKSVFVISTCNRTEIYGYAHHPHELAALLTRFTRGTMPQLLEHGFTASGPAAMHHLFRVAAGLDSQIIGDYEIQGQLKQAVSFARSRGMVGPIMDRTINFVFQASKKIRSTTQLSSGTVSVAFAAIEWLQHHVQQQHPSVLVIGTGKFGRNVCKNLLQYMPGTRITLCNRTQEAALALAPELNADVLRYSEMPAKVQEFDAVIVSTAALEPIVKKEFFKSNRKRHLIDLSVPMNIEPAVGELDDCILVNVDDISAMLDKTIAMRQGEVPKAESIIAGFEAEFYQWLHTYKHTPAIRHIKQQLTNLGIQHTSGCEMASDAILTHADLNELVQETVNHLMVSLKQEGDKGCRFIEAYQQFLNHPTIAAVAVS